MKSNDMLSGDVISQGVAFGGACLFKEDLLESAPQYSIAKDKIEDEKKRLITAIENAKRELSKKYNRIIEALGMSEAQVFNAHIMILEDFSFIDQMEGYIRDDLVNAEEAVIKTTLLYEKKFKTFPEEYFRERIADIKDIAKLLLNHLGVKHSGFACSFHHEKPAVVVADNLTPSLIAALENKLVAAIVTEEGSKVSHGAILARALGVPVIIRAKGIVARVKCSTPILIDASKGYVYLNPNPETISHYRSILNKSTKAEKKYNRGFVTTTDGVRIRLHANAGSIHDIKNAQKYGINNIGLFRTEFIFLGREIEPSIDEQVEIYRKILDSTNGTVSLRLLDIGGDKLLGYLSLPKQDNPKLGLRGARIYNKYPTIITNQIRALLMAKGQSPLKILIPMISTLEEFYAIKDTISVTLNLLKEEYHINSDNLEIGCMIEVPAAVHMIQYFAEEADFLSIGTNDLVQYIMGVDRSNMYLDELYEPLQPAVLRVLKSIVENTKESGKEISVCGEIASDPKIARILVGLGFRSLSINPHYINTVGDAISECSVKDLEKDIDDIFRFNILANIKKIIAEKY